jgi:ABC-type uncharacterized transport system ATPase component
VAAEKKAYELKANVQSAQIQLGNKLIVFEEGRVYETADRVEQQDLDAFDAVKVAEPKKGDK